MPAYNAAKTRVGQLSAPCEANAPGSESVATAGRHDADRLTFAGLSLADISPVGCWLLEAASAVRAECRRSDSPEPDSRTVGCEVRSPAFLKPALYLDDSNQWAAKKEIKITGQILQQYG